jgi:tRNA threonylcarbamoyladenosine biosynthesis protein TsaB
MGLLARAGVTLHDVNLFAVARGPGSFTGLRVGIATMQGLAFATGKPLIGVSALDALAAIGAAGARARTTGADRPIATWIDAWRGEVYAALYQDGREVQAPTVEPPAAVLDRVHAARPIFIGDAVPMYAEAIRGVIGADACADPPCPLLAGAIGSLALDAWSTGLHPSPDEIRPLYVRRTDAELSRDARALR